MQWPPLPRHWRHSDTHPSSQHPSLLPLRPPRRWRRLLQLLLLRPPAPPFSQPPSSLSPPRPSSSLPLPSHPRLGGRLECRNLGQRAPPCYQPSSHSPPGYPADTQLSFE